MLDSHVQKTLATVSIDGIRSPWAFCVEILKPAFEEEGSQNVEKSRGLSWKRVKERLKRNSVLLFLMLSPLAAVATVAGEDQLLVSFEYGLANDFDLKSVFFESKVTGGTPPYSYAWLFGDGSSGAGGTVVHTYGLDDMSSGRAFLVELQVSDSQANTAIAWGQVWIGAEPLTPQSIPLDTSQEVNFVLVDDYTDQLKSEDSMTTFSIGTLQTSSIDVEAFSEVSLGEEMGPVSYETESASMDVAQEWTVPLHSESEPSSQDTIPAEGLSRTLIAIGTLAAGITGSLGIGLMLTSRRGRVKRPV